MLNNQVTLTRHSIADLMYPVGSYYITESEELNTVEKMNAFFGGTWVQITERFLYASTSAGSTGGNKEHNHSLNPGFAKVSFGWESESNRLMMSLKSVDSYVTNTYNGASYWPDPTGTTYRGSNYLAAELGGNTGNTNNMPPYRTVYMYRRTA